MNKQVKKYEHKANTEIDGLPTKGWAGIVLLFVCISIIYANYSVWFGTDGWVPILMTVPSTLFVGAFLVHKAIK